MAGSDRVFDNLTQFGRLQFVTLSSRLRARELQNPLDHSGQPAPFITNQAAIAFDLRAVVNYTVGQVLRRRTDYCERRAQFMRYSGDELHLLCCEALGTAAGQDDEADARAQQQKNTEADREVAAARICHVGFE